MLSVVVILADSTRCWLGVLQARTPVLSTEIPFTPRVSVAGD